MTAPLAGSDRVEVGLGARGYAIHIGQGILRDAPALLPFPAAGLSCYILTDENAAPCAETLSAALAAAGARTQSLILPAGEQTKSWAQLAHVTSWMIQGGAARDSVLFAVGGGVIGDLGGFAAAAFMRGIRFVQVPTTLLAQVDSSVGGKTGINVPEGKNLVGAFHQPAAVIADTGALRTLPPRELRAGYAEIVKYALIGDAEFFLWLERHGPDVLSLAPAAVARAVGVSCRKKAEIVAMDERESGPRALLNLGHTFGHALEAAAGYDGSLLHGEAVSVGMVLAFRLSARLGLCQEADADAIAAHLSRAGLPVRIGDVPSLRGADPDAIAAFMTRDKKMAAGRLTFILARGIGGAFAARDVDFADAVHVIRDDLGA